LRLKHHLTAGAILCGQFPTACCISGGMTDRPTKISFGEMRDSGVWPPDLLR
jgi:hypothetical protein